MARISTYTTDTDVVGSDKVLGTDAAGNATKNYRMDGIGKYLSKSGRAAVGRQMSFVWLSDLSGGRVNGSMSLEAGGVANLSALTSVILSETTTDGRNQANFISYMNGKTIFMMNAENPNVFAAYNVLSIDAHATISGVKVLTLEFIEGYGAMAADDVFVMSAYEEGSTAAYTHVQSAASATWTVNHNLGKRPSVMVVDSADTTVLVPITYVDDNTLTINLSSPTSGKAYIN